MAEKDTKTTSKSASKSKSASETKTTTAKASAKTDAKAKATTEKPKAKTSSQSSAKTTKESPSAKTKTAAKSEKSATAPAAAKEKSTAKTAKSNASSAKAKSEPVKEDKAKSKTTQKVDAKQADGKQKPKAEPKNNTASAAKSKSSPVKDEKPKTKSSEKAVDEKSKAKTSSKSAEAEVLAASAIGKSSKTTPIKEEKTKSTSAKEKEQVKSKEKSEPKKQSDKKQSENKKAKKTTSNDSKNSVNKKAIIIGVICAVVVLSLISGITAKAIMIRSGSYTYEYANATTVGFASKDLGTINRVKPVSEIKNEGYVAESCYPIYGHTPANVLGDANATTRSRLISESSYLTATGTWNAGGGGYTWMDKDGYLYSGTTANPIPTVNTRSEHRQLYQHTASVGLYYGDVADSEPGRIKEITFRPRQYTRGYNVTGLYAPAGEVVKIQISEKDMNATGGISVHIGQALYNGKANNIWLQKNQMQRFPVILNTMVITKDTATLENGVYTAYVGSFLGGPIYIRNESVTFKATISGGVTYSHFILGYTTKEEFEQNAKSSAPYFDLEVWDNGVLHSGPNLYAKNFSYDDLYKAAILWEKVSLVTTTKSTQGIVFLYDPFVAAGAAVAFPGQGSVNCPAGWMSNSLNYESITTSGAWGNFHEYHHNFQGYGVGNGGEVTNNGMTLVSYSLFTKISSSRGLDSYGAEGLGGWNSYTSATWALEEVLKIARADQSPSNGNQGLALYATLLHNFGPDNYIQAKVTQSGGQNYLAYLKAWQNVTHNDMTYYFKDILQGITAEQAAELTNPEYSMFVPVSSVYQTGRSYMYDGEKKYITTMQPFVINYGEDYTFDLNKYTYEGGMYKGGSINIPEGFSFSIKEVKQPQYGKVTSLGDNKYTYTPDKKNMNSGEIIVTLQITKDNDPSFKVDDVDLVLEFEQTHEKNKFTLERTTYTYDSGKMYTDAVEAYENNYKNYSSKVEGNNLNGVQNSNTDIWYYPNTDAYKDSPYVVKENTVAEVSGKLYFKDGGKYRLYLRGRSNCAMYYSIGDDKHFELGGKITSASPAVSNTANFRTGDANTYVDIEVEAESWVYFKLVLIVELKPQISFIGLGFGQWQDPLFTIQEKKDENGNVIGTIYYDQMGREVSEEEVNNAQPVAPTKVSYCTAYRSDYEFPTKKFEADYFYTRKYNYNYVGDTIIVTEGKKQIPTADCNYIAWTPAEQSIDNLFDGKSDTGIHFSSAWGVSANKPAILAFDIGEAVTANTMTLYTYLQTGSNSKGFPSTFTLEGSLDGKEYFDMGSWTGQSQPAVSRDYLLKDGKAYTFRYYRLTVTASNNGRCALNGLTFSNTIRFTGDGNNLFSPDNEMFTFSRVWRAEQAYSMFGHVYVGKKGYTMKFEFEGTNFIILSSSQYANKFEVKIDGKVVSSMDLKEEKDEIYASYISSSLSSGKHKVEIKCKSKASIDSIAIYDMEK
ncbi:MAG: M60 family metallopeptidase [Clostridia bacterium]|nr:M60 family metallopeptidase [Clostridia bacterium]